jgi:nitrogen fixation NifU-like protein
VTVELRFDGDVVSAVSVRGQGCSISQSSASMMSTAIKGRSRAEIADLIRRFKAMMDIESSEPVVDADRPGAALGDLEALQGVRQYPVRIKCANLAWTTLEEALSA